MRTLFADTQFWVALANSQDQWHQRARSVTAGLVAVQIVTTQEVLIEFFNALGGSRHLRYAAVSLLAGLQTRLFVEIIPQSPASFVSGLQLYEQREDKQYSLTDCISMRAMRDRSITEVLTHDHHFMQEGFTVLL